MGPLYQPLMIDQHRAIVKCQTKGSEKSGCNETLATIIQDYPEILLRTSECGAAINRLSSGTDL
jgi:hypothetical protein